MPRRKKSSNENQSRSSLSINKDKPQQRYAANARERARMRVLSRAFCRLKTTLPWVPADTKLSKLDTLRLAASYIAHLKGILREEDLGSSESSLHPAMSMTWPFGFNRPLGGSPGGGSHDEGSLEDCEDEDVDDDGESISSCTWEEVTPTAKDCIHLDSRRSSSVGGGRARGKGNNNNNSQNSEDKESPSSQLSTKSSATNHGCLNSNTIIANTSRPLSQTQQHHFRNSGAMFHPQTDKLGSEMMTGTNLENAPPPPTSSLQEEIHVGSASSNPGNIDLFAADMNSGSSASYTQQHNYHHHHPHQHPSHISDSQSLLHHLVPSSPFGFSNDLISIG
ncbi:unnamed protein product [Orchesella dallaii]|uniref:BHLH domain-containing protein n=1 Tax=Orchesella dallaii TaxID=48710 RepID=A0ABP1PN31_9HEXA